MRFYKRWRRSQVPQSYPSEPRLRRRQPRPPPREDLRPHEYVMVQSEPGMPTANPYRSTYRSAQYPTLENKYSKRPASLAQLPLQPLSNPDPTLTDLTAGMSALRSSLVPTALPAPGSVDPLSPPGPIGEIFKTGTLSKAPKKE